VNATASRPPIAAAYAPIVFFTWYANTASASSAARLPDPAAASMSRRSPPAMPDSPASPPPFANCVRTSSQLQPCRSIM
jgi:hypothetical protein